MQPLPERLLKNLDLAGAFSAELAAQQNQLPEAPLLDGLQSSASRFIRWLSGQLRAGLAVAPQVVVPARKSGNGVRPVPIVGFAERVAYRALVQWAVRDLQSMDRSPTAYLRFVQAPILWSREIKAPNERPYRVQSSGIKYVVKADITAFYQYVDHDLLSTELLNLTGEFETVSAIVDLLGELTGRIFGLPQLLDPSDWLSDIYADILERDMHRRGYRVWRFNDDFRIACDSYSDALRAIEALDDGCRTIGLTLNEHKTFTIKFINYAFDTMGLTVEDEIPDVEAQDVEGVVADYTEMEDPGDAAGSLDLVVSTVAADENAALPQGTLNLQHLSIDDYRRLRRALRGLARVANPEGAAACTRLLAYAPSLTPHVARYFLALAGPAPDEVDTALRDVVQRLSLSDWQRMWMVRVARAIDIVGHPEIMTVVKGWQHSDSGFLRAEVTLALAEAGVLSISDVESGLRFEPSVLQPWYLAAVLAMRSTTDEVTDAYLKALRNGGRLAAWLIPEPAKS